MNGRDKRRRIKDRRVRSDELVVRSQNKNPIGIAVLPKATAPARGKFCRARGANIDESVCTVQSTRMPAQCVGCQQGGNHVA